MPQNTMSDFICGGDSVDARNFKLATIMKYLFQNIEYLKKLSTIQIWLMFRDFMVRLLLTINSGSLVIAFQRVQPSWKSLGSTMERNTPTFWIAIQKHF